ncbi:hypothetical protein D3C73_944350 [compost metagenome]
MPDDLSFPEPPVQPIADESRCIAALAEFAAEGNHLLIDFKIRIAAWQRIGIRIQPELYIVHQERQLIRMEGEVTLLLNNPGTDRPDLRLQPLRSGRLAAQLSQQR